jgi:hypothetical protein
MTGWKPTLLLGAQRHTLLGTEAGQNVGGR